MRDTSGSLDTGHRDARPARYTIPMDLLQKVGQNELERHPLALHAWCRHMREEIGLLWLEYIDLHFGSSEIMLPNLFTTPGG